MGRKLARRHRLEVGWVTEGAIGRVRLDQPARVYLDSAPDRPIDAVVSRIDPETDVVTATIPVGEGPDGIAAASGVVWVSGEFSEEIARIDPDENVVVERVPIANRPKGLAIS